MHAVEHGKNIFDNTVIAFGGAAPLHAARLCEKLGVDRCLIPRGAGVGSAIGFLKAPFGYEALASKIMRLSKFDAASINTMLDQLKATAEGFVRAGTDGAITREVTAFMRYAGQGWEIPVPMPEVPFVDADKAAIEKAFKERYAQFFGRAVEGPEVEFVTWSVKAQDIRPEGEKFALDAGGRPASGHATRKVFDPASGKELETAIVPRDALAAGARISDPPSSSRGNLDRRHFTVRCRDPGGWHYPARAERALIHERHQ